MFIGRLGRLQFLVRILGCATLVAIWHPAGIGDPGTTMSGTWEAFSSGGLTSAVAITVLPLVLLLNFAYRRVQDLGVHGAWSFPPAGLHLALVLTGQATGAAAIGVLFLAALLLLPTGAGQRLGHRLLRQGPPELAATHARHAHFGSQTGDFSAPTETRHFD